METVMEKLHRGLMSIRRKTDFVPAIGIVLGSGLGDFADRIQVAARIPYGEIEDFPVSTVAGHKGQFIFGTIEGKKVVAMQGRVHYYEGYQMPEVVLPIRLMGLLGIKKLLLTNAAGGINEAFKAGDFMMITDHIATAIPNPLIGANPDGLGERFPDMSEVYSKKLQQIIRRSAGECAISLKEGVYVQFTGPSYETPAEVRLARWWGADAVGMSTACEAIAARHMQIEVCGISCITNMAAGIVEKKLDHQEVQKMADQVSGQFENLVRHILRNM